MPEPNKFYVTTPIYYVNDKPHLGHVYTTMVADVVARYHRLRGDDVFFLTGVDEHSTKVVDKAAEKGLTTEAWAEQNATAFRQTFEKLEMTNDDFVRTSSDHHKRKVTEYVAALLKSGDVYEGEYEGWYDAGQEEYVPENKAKDNDYKSEVNRKPLVRKKEKNYFFKLSSYVPALLDHFEKHPTFVQPDARRNEIVNRIKEAQDVPISRTGVGGWGIPVPGDPEQTIYVWIDALFNYLSYVDTPDRRGYWQSGATHFIAKDILWFHASVWPAMLMALRKCDGYDWVNLPAQVYSHSYWVSESGAKMSKSLGNFLDPAAIDNYVAEFGLDALRYFLATRGPLSVSDSTFSPDLFIKTYNEDLANTFGNSCSRVANMIGKYFDGVMPPVHAEFDDNQNSGAETNDDGDTTDSFPIHLDGNEGLGIRPSHSGNLLAVAIGSSRHYRTAINETNLTVAAERALRIVRGVDTYIELKKPFSLAKDWEQNERQVATVLANCAEALRIASVLLWPFIPDACEKFWKRIGCDYAAQMAANGGRGRLDEWTQWGQLKPGTPIEKGDALFPRYDPNK
ncbi:MAG: methionine--tRNA ligase [Phycisphaera sp.]|nr:methionine--tRNA ligase [Phycisphaera sp.]